ncbi:uncharacterized protein G2W53_020802 [Senna tora]|uniref:Uncharacterized protein n=1 Tax=Senna tora TaxID=362788 RepID=A0A834TI68_9FABA|nr:uncharacterized protein G2W53_020802 [Senna tora]
MEVPKNNGYNKRRKHSNPSMEVAKRNKHSRRV